VGRFQGWLFAPVPLGRIAALRTLAYLFVVFDVLVYTPEAAAKQGVPTDLYLPLQVDRWLPLIPEPTTLVVQTVFWGLLVLAPLAATGRAPRLLGWLLFLLYFEWMLIDMSYGKVDHDRFAFLVALAVLPTVGAARHGDPRASEGAGWAVRMVQLGVVATYFLAAVAKLRFGGVEWLWGTTLTWAVVRRGTVLARWTLQVPWLLTAAQFGIVAFELMSPLIFVVREQLQRWMVAYFYLFHLVTWLAIGISFAPHLVAMSGFLPLERVRPLRWVAGIGTRSRRRLLADPA
jgi:hypothetical protein